MTTLKTLIDSTQFESARPLWDEGLAYAVLEPFFACLLVNLTQHKEFVWHEKFIAHSAHAATIGLQTGEFADDLDLYWRKAHLDLKQYLIQSTGADDGVLTRALPLAVHAAWAKLGELATQQGQSIQEFAKNELTNSLKSLPSWAEQVMDETVLAELSIERLMLDALTNKPTPTAISDQETSSQEMPSQVYLNKQDTPTAAQSDEEDDDDEEEETRSNTLPIALGVLLAVVLAGAGVWFLKQDKTEQVATPTPQATTLVAQNRPPPTLSVSVGLQGELYACHARLGNREQYDELLKVLGANFGSTTCVMDISEQVSQTMTGLDKLTNALAILKTAPYATLELVGNEVLINAPDPNTLNRLIDGIGALMAGMTVKPMPALNVNDAINKSLITASDALQKLPDGANTHELATALSLQKIDTQGATIPEINKAVLALSAGKIATSPNSRLIIVVHSDDTGDRMMARTQTQMLADAIKAELIAQGASEHQLVAQGVGFDFPMAENQTELGRFKNRRVEFLVYDDAIMQALAQPLMQPAMPAPTNAPPATYAVVDGQIVDTSTLPTVIPSDTVSDSPPMPAPQHELLPSIEVVPPVPTEPVITQDEISVAPGYIVPAEVPPPPSMTPSSPIPDDLVQQIGVDSDTVPSAQIEQTETE